MNVLVAGTVAIDDVKTPKANRTDLMGGSGAYAAMAASFFAPTRLVGIVGKDFPAAHLETLRTRGVCTDGIEHSAGDSFRWSGEYHENMDNRTTHSVAINVLEAYEPKLPETYRSSEMVVLGNMSPRNQLDVLGQCEPRYAIADTMDIWIQAERKELLEMLGRIDLLVINESEAKLFMETTNLVKAGRALLGLGPDNVIIKTGEHGALLFGRGEHDFYRTGAYPLEHVEDPTGAGDCFLGGLAGHLAAESGGGKPDFTAIKHAIARGTVLASFNCESFSVEGLVPLTEGHIADRLQLLHRYTQL